MMQNAKNKPGDRIDKAVAMLALVPQTGVITRIARQAYTIMMFLAREQSSGDESGVYHSPLSSILSGFDGSTGSRAELQRHLLSMLSHTVEWQTPSTSESQEWGACTLLAEVRIFTKNGELWLSWAYPPSIKAEVLTPLRYAQIRRTTIGKFRSYAALTLYEICTRYKDVPSRLTGKQRWSWWVPVLKGKPKADKVIEYRYFNRDTLQPAVQEVNEVSELDIELREIKVGRTIEFLQFEVRKKAEEVLNVRPKPLDVSMLIQAELLGIPRNEAETLYLNEGAVAFGVAVEKLKQRLASGAAIVSKIAYFRALLKNQEARLAPAAQKKPVIALPPQSKNEEVSPVAGNVLAALNHFPLLLPSVAAPLATPLITAERKENPAQATLDQITAKQRERTQQIQDEFSSKTLSDMEELLREFTTATQDAPGAGKIKQLIDDGRWRSAAVMGSLMRFYWKKTRGEEWGGA